MEIKFPIEFLVHGTPVSAQSKLPKSRETWREQVKSASRAALPDPHFASDQRLAVTLYYFPPEPMQGDIDNIVKPILDALSKHVYIDDHQIDRVVVQKFELSESFAFGHTQPVLAGAQKSERPVLYIRISNDPYEDLA